MEDTLSHLYKDLDAYAKTGRMPVMFVGHGSPMNVLGTSPYAMVWKGIGKHLPRPRAIVCMSAHWITDGTYISAVEKPSLIYDFYGFPEELYQITYPARGSVPIAQEFVNTISDIKIDSERGLDHGTWTVLKHFFPNADIPVLQLSIDFSHPRRVQYELIQKLQQFREKGIFFVGSGNIIHNLMALRFNTEPYPWATTFDTHTKKLLAEHAVDTLITTESAEAIPTDDHYRPMLNTLALTEPGESIHFFSESIDLGSVGMRSFISL